MNFGTPWHMLCLLLRLFQEAVMVSETELFYLVMLILLTLIIHLVLSTIGPGRGGKAHR